MTSPAAPRYAGLDGLRAVAVLLVVVYHLFPAWFLHSGFVGVDVFFVISGFLITSLLLRERAASGRIALRAFWTRRARRLLPALALVVTVSSSAAWLVGGDVLVDLGRQVLGAATFSYNWVAIADGASYFSGAEPELFRNLWSLAVEEQFYVLWPLLLPALLLVRRRWLRITVALALAAASALWAAALVTIVTSASDTSGGALTRAYYGTDSHAFGLLIGVALALLLAARMTGDRMPGPRPIVAGVAGWVALAALIAVAAWPGGASLYPYIPLAASVLTAVVIALAVGASSRFGRALDVQPLRWIGERSYGIYLWHWPIVVLLTVATTGSFVDAAIPVPVGILAALITVVASALSYRFLEQPVRRLGFRGALRAFGQRLSGNPGRRFGAIATVVAAALALGGTSAAVAAAPPLSSSEAVVQAGMDALAKASAAPASETTGTGDADAAAAPTPGSTNAPAEHSAAESDAPAAAACATHAAGAHAAAPTSEAHASAPAGADALSTPPAADADPCTGPGGRPLPPAELAVPGDRISAVGDSVMLASAGGLLDELPGIQIDAAVSRSMWAGTDIVASLAATGALRDYVVVGLGTNGPVGADELQQVYDAIGPDRTLVLVTAFAPRNWIDGVNAELASFTASHPRVVVADWSHAIAPHLDYLAGDQIHPGPTGGQVYADTVADAVNGVENQHAQVRYEVELIRWAATRTFEPQP